jgi:hypothetical protein
LTELTVRVQVRPQHADFDAMCRAWVEAFTVGIGGDGRGYDLGLLRELVQWRDGAR